jgi:CheY-like chemotaxis protein
MAPAAAQKIEQRIRDGMARALWVHAFMIWATDVDPGPAFSGGTWDEVAPDSAATRQVSGQAADALMELLVAANQAPLTTLLSFSGSEASDVGDQLARVCLGVLDVEDSVFLRTAIILPPFRVELDDDGDTLTWDGEIDDGMMGNPGTGTMVLLIEDDPALQRSTTRMIRKIYPDARVIVADNADAAIADLQVHDIEVVVSDYDLIGNKTGGDVFTWVQANQPHLVDHYVFFTGNDAPQAMHYRFVQKPADVSELKRGLTAPAPTARTRTAPRPPVLVAAPPSTGPLDITAFAQAVKAALPKIAMEPGRDDPKRPRGRYHSKVFISAIQRKLGEDPRYRGVSKEAFHRMLLDANRQGLLELARADLVGAMDRQEVADSEIEDRGATYHFVRDPDWG